MLFNRKKTNEAAQPVVEEVTQVIDEVAQPVVEELGQIIDETAQPVVEGSDTVHNDISNNPQQLNGQEPVKEPTEEELTDVVFNDSQNIAKDERVDESFSDLTVMAQSEKLREGQIHLNTKQVKRNDARGGENDIRVVYGSMSHDKDIQFNVVRTLLSQRGYSNVRREGDDNIVYYNSISKEDVLLNPPGFDYGDVMENLPIAYDFVGSILGGWYATLRGAAKKQMPGQKMSIDSIISDAKNGAIIGSAIGATTIGALNDLFSDANLDLPPHLESQVFMSRIENLPSDLVMNLFSEKIGQYVSIGLGKMVGGKFVFFKEKVREMTENYIRLQGDYWYGRGLIFSQHHLTGNKKVIDDISNQPGGADYLSKMYEENIKVVKNVFGKLTTKVNKNIDVGGHSVGKTIKKFVIKSDKDFREFMTGQYETFFERADPSTNISLDNVAKTQTFLEEKLVVAEGSLSKYLKPALAKIGNLLSDKGNGNLNVSTLHEIKTLIGQDLQDIKLNTGDSKNKYVRMVYGALLEDISASLRKANGVDLSEEYKVLNVKFKNYIDEHYSSFEKIIQLGEPEKIYQRIVNGGSVQDLVALKKYFGDSWDNVVDNSIYSLGVKNSGKVGFDVDRFDTITFVENWKYGKGISEEARKIIFTGKYKGLDKQLDNLLLAIEKLRLTSDVTAGNMGKFSLRNLAGLGLVSASTAPLFTQSTTDDKKVIGYATGAVGIWGSFFLVPRMRAKLMTNPRFVKWIVDSANNVSDFNSFTRHIAKLLPMSKKEGIEEEVAAFIKDVERMAQPGEQDK